MIEVINVSWLSEENHRPLVMQSNGVPFFGVLVFLVVPW